MLLAITSFLTAMNSNQHSSHDSNPLVRCACIYFPTHELRMTHRCEMRYKGVGVLIGLLVQTMFLISIDLCCFLSPAEIFCSVMFRTVISEDDFR